MKSKVLTLQAPHVLNILTSPLGSLDPKDFYIIWPSNLSVLIVPDEGYSRKASSVLN